MSTIDLSVMVPALNEQDNLEATVENIVRAAHQVTNLSVEIIIVDDGSTDRTPEVSDALADKHNFVRVIHHVENRGVGRSLKEVIQVVNGTKFLIIPGDNDMSYDLILSMFRNVHTADVVLCFFLNREVRGRARNTLSILYNLIYMSVFNVFVQYINGPCVYPTAAVRESNVVSSGFSVPAEITTKLLKKGLTFYEISGYMQTGLRGSTSLSFKNLREVIVTFVRIVYEMKWAKRGQYDKMPVRIAPQTNIEGDLSAAQSN